MNYAVFISNCFVFQDMYKRKPGLPAEVAHYPENKVKNRYRDILPCKCGEPSVVCVSINRPKDFSLSLNLPELNA